MLETTKETIFQIFKGLPGVPALIEADAAQKRKKISMLLTERADAVKVQEKAVAAAASKARAADKRLEIAQVELKRARVDRGVAMGGQCAVSHFHDKKIGAIDRELEELAEPVTKELAKTITEREEKMRSGEGSDDKVVELERLMKLKDRLTVAHLQPNLERVVSNIETELRKGA